MKSLIIILCNHQVSPNISSQEWLIVMICSGNIETALMTALLKKNKNISEATKNFQDISLK